MTRPSDRAIAQALYELIETKGFLIGGTLNLVVERARELDAAAAPVVVGEDSKRLDFIERADYIAMPKGAHIGSCRASIDAAMAAALAED